jgi:hypothetical protein
MMMKYPAQFEKVAREWAIKYAGAPKTTKWSESLAAQAPVVQSKAKTHKSREEELRQQALRYVLLFREKGGDYVNTDGKIDIKGIIKTSSTDSLIWVSISIAWWTLSTT